MYKFIQSSNLARPENKFYVENRFLLAQIVSSSDIAKLLAKFERFPVILVITYDKIYPVTINIKILM